MSTSHCEIYKNDYNHSTMQVIANPQLDEPIIDLRHTRARAREDKDLMYDVRNTLRVMTKSLTWWVRV